MPKGVFSGNTACTFPGCTNKHHGHGLCAAHLIQQRRGQPLRPIGLLRGPTDHLSLCGKEGCPWPYGATNFCQDHVEIAVRWPRDKRNWLRGLYHMEPEQYEALYEAQGGLCAICKQPETGTREGQLLPLAIDHDHGCCPEVGRSCGRCIRKLLCKGCNSGLGHFQDNPELLEAAAAYLLEFQKQGQDPVPMIEAAIEEIRGRS